MAREDWKRTERATAYEAGFLTAGYDRLERPDGEIVDYHWVDRPDVASVVAVEDGDVVLVEQYRQRFDARTLECPAGLVEDGESLETAATRELREETGFRAGSVTLLETVRPTAWTTHEQAVVVATDLEPGEQDVDEGECIDVHRVPAASAVERVREFGPVTGWTLSALAVGVDEDVL